jgi:type IV fimbrial biogenesis protein FimT
MRLLTPLFSGASCGYSLIDLLFTLALFSILLSLTFPVYKHLIINVRLFSLSEQMASSINYARSEAIKRREVIILCGSRDGKTCGGPWHDGWIIFSGKIIKNSPKNDLLHVHPALSENEFLEWHGAGGRNYVQLNPDGSAYGHNGSFVICVKLGSEETMWLIKLSQTGRMRIDRKINYRWSCHY